MDWKHHVTQSQLKSGMPEFGPGDQVRIWCKILEQDRVRLSPFEGIVIRRRGSGVSESVTVRRITHGEGVERVFPLHTPTVDRIEVLRRGKVRRARLYYLRKQVGKTRIAAVGTESSPAPSSGETQTPSS